MSREIPFEPTYGVPQGQTATPVARQNYGAIPPQQAYSAQQGLTTAPRPQMEYNMASSDLTRVNPVGQTAAARPAQEYWGAAAGPSRPIAQAPAANAMPAQNYKGATAETDDIAELLKETEDKRAAAAATQDEAERKRVSAPKPVTIAEQETKTPVAVIAGNYPRPTSGNDEEYIASDTEIETIFSEKAGYIPDGMELNKELENINRDAEAELEEIKKAFKGNEAAVEAARSQLGFVDQEEYARTYISYFGEPDVDKYQLAARKIRGRIESRNPVTGVVINSAPIEKNPKTGKRDIAMQVLMDDDGMQCIPAWIAADDMTLSYARIPDDRRLGFKESFGRRVIGARISFMPKELIAGNPKAKNAADKEYSLTGSRVDFLAQMRRRYLDDLASPDALHEKSLVEGVVVAVYGNRILFNVAGVDLLLWTTIPYITGVSYLSETDMYGGKRLFRLNDKKPCVIDRIKRDEQNNVTGIHLNFRIPLRKKIHEIASSLQHGNYLQGTILRFARGPSINGREGREFAIIKCSIGIEAACPIPAWDVLPPIGSDVTLKVIFVDRNDRVYGHAKRNA